MSTFNNILSTLKMMETNDQRNEFLNSIITDPTVGRHDLRRIVCQIFIDDNFVEKYFLPTPSSFIKKKLSRIFQNLNLFRNKPKS